MARPTEQALPRYPGKALAILSCALALLAAHPVTARAAQTEDIPAVRTIAAEPAAFGLTPRPLAERGTGQRTIWDDKARGVRGSDSARGERAFAAALGHLARMFLSELTVCAPQLMPALAQITLDDPSASLLPDTRYTPFPDLPQPSERAYAIVHCLLAPPC